MLYELAGYNTDCRYSQDIRYRQYTTSKKKADAFNKIPKIQFTDSGHGIVFRAREMSNFDRKYKKPPVSVLSDYVRQHLKT